MLDDLPGWFWQRDEPIPQGNLVRPGEFRELAELLTPTLAAADIAAARAADVIASVNADGFDVEYAMTVHVAAAEVDAQRDADRDVTAGALVDAGDNTQPLRASVLSHLPGVDTPIPIDFTEPPGPPPAVPPDDDGRDDRNRV